MSALFFWAILGVGALIIEVLTGTFYALAIALSSFFVAFLVWITHSQVIEIWHTTMFVALTITSIFSVSMLSRVYVPGRKTGIDALAGLTGKIEKIQDEWKVRVYGVPYVIHASSVTSEFHDGMFVKIEGAQDGLLLVSRL